MAVQFFYYDNLNLIYDLLIGFDLHRGNMILLIKIFHLEVIF